MTPLFQSIPLLWRHKKLGAKTGWLREYLVLWQSAEERLRPRCRLVVLQESVSRAPEVRKRQPFREKQSHNQEEPEQPRMRHTCVPKGVEGVDGF